MNLKEYIASGIIESYVMGLASVSERAEFEQMCARYPELVAERRKFEESLEAFASDQALHPPVDVKAKVLKEINSMENTNSQRPRSIGLLRFVAAASVILLVGMVVLYYQVNQQNKDLAETNKKLGERLNQAEGALTKAAQEIAIPNTTQVNMVGTKVAPKSSADVYWDSASSHVYLVVKNMPQLASDKQYQLWALIDNKQRDLGVFDAADRNVILKMKDTKNAQAFAITIEKKGGSPTPTLDSLATMGKTQASQ